uniref:S24/S26 family peptidase n=1 Tax=Agathobacter sp. TaxID=2021311 RepID=UPI0040575010
MNNIQKNRQERMSPLEKEIASGKPMITITVGDSMKPLLLHRSSRVVIVKADKELKKNDLPMYKRPNGKFVMHRIIKVDEDFYYTRGDNRAGLEKVPKEWVQGVVTEIYRKEKHFSVDNRWYQCYVTLWNMLYPFRWFFYKLRSIKVKVLT